MIVTERPGKFKTRIEIDWNYYDPTHLDRWCMKNFNWQKDFIYKAIRNADYDYNHYYYFRCQKNAMMFILKWSKK
jgi:hypothetical protein